MFTNTISGGLASYSGDGPQTNEITAGKVTWTSGAPPVAGDGFPNIWNGSAWAAHPVKHWNGTAWEQKPMKRWSGSAWIAV